MILIVEAMDLEDIPQVLEVDRESYTLPWPASAYRREILHNRNARYMVLRELAPGVPVVPEEEVDPRPKLPFGFFRRTMKPAGPVAERGPILGYAGMWLMVDEAHITTIAIRNQHRGKGLGELLLVSLIEAAQDVGAVRVTLEVRVSNDPAQQLYRKYGFTQEGVRPRYYSDNNEDAYIMSTGDIREALYRYSFRSLVNKLAKRFASMPEIEVVAPPFSNSAVGRIG